MNMWKPLYTKILIFLSLAVLIEFGVLFSINAVLRTHLENDIEQYFRRYKAETTRFISKQVETTVFQNSILQKGELSGFAWHNKNPMRQILIKLVKDYPQLTQASIVGMNNEIIISSELPREGKLAFDKSSRRRLLLTKEPLLVSREKQEHAEHITLLQPLMKEGHLFGQLLLTFSIPDLYDFSPARQTILFAAGVILAILLGGAFFLFAWIEYRVDKISREAVQKKTEGKAARATPRNDLPQPEGGSIFSRLNRLYEKSADLDKSFQESEQKIHSMMQVLNQGLLILDLNMRIITHNEYVLDVLQIRTASNASKKVYELFQNNPQLIEMYRHAKDPASLDETFVTHEVKQIFYLQLLNGRKISVEVLSKPFYQNDEVIGVIFYIKNLDMLNELEHTLQRSMKYGVISQLSSSIGHEIRNPLSSLAIHTEIVDSMVTKSVDDKMRLKKIKKSIKILNSEVERLQKLIDQFFNLAKAQKITLTYENINDLMNIVYSLVHQQALEKNITIRRVYAKDIPMIKVSKDQLKQVIINLILNSFDAMPEGGELTIRTRYDEQKVIIAIKDTGHGIPENIRDNIFDLYFTTKDSGGGIGLAISRKIIEAHEGKLYFETKTGVGTVFYIELPTSQK